MADDGEIAPTVHDRDAAVAHLKSLVTSDHLGLERFDAALESVLAAKTYTELETALRGLPSTVPMTPAARRLKEPLLIQNQFGRTEMVGRWQLGEHTVVKVHTGRVLLDLTAVEFDAVDSTLEMHVHTGRIDVIVPLGVSIQLVEVGGIRNELGDQATTPGAPLIRVRASAKHGHIYLRRPAVPRRRWWRRDGRRAIG